MESCALAEVRFTPNAAPSETIQLDEANVLGAETTNVPLLTMVAPE